MRFNFSRKKYYLVSYTGTGEDGNIKSGITGVTVLKGYINAYKYLNSLNKSENYKSSTINNFKRVSKREFEDFFKND